MVIPWACPNCGLKQADNFSNVLRPVCTGCEHVFYWIEVTSQQQIIKAVVDDALEYEKYP